MTVYVGIDVSKAQLDLAVGPTGPVTQVANNGGGIATVVHELQGVDALVVVEATGGYETAVVAALATAGVPVVVANPRQVRDFGRATGQLAKTDRIDAQLLALFADRVRPTPRPLADDATQAVQALLTRRRQLVDMLTAERNRLEHAAGAIRRSVTQHIRWLEKQLGQWGSILGTLTESFVTYLVRGTVSDPEVTVSPLGFGSR